ncbi:PREDICTED: uncharacterized protein LOC105954139 [Erythranthe guttata]|uniref:uncharacterized protein LOC105954139 n=1 Tax=Erythranthe guttata TaxID=4155 RepID=UPI00064DDF6B|nr:PREDICTED: uncharacterized protein LOC105954139 [Erythranthe guttata]|eukprot:XP_012833267.1 PREDICTED: uncharacterized protein LOC105954139 [Erythranthe guttata]
MQMKKLNLMMKKSDSDNCHQCHIQGLSVAGLRLPKANLSHEYQLKKAVTANHQYLIFTEAVQTVRTSFVCVICQDVRNGFVSDCKLTNKGNIICPPQGMGWGGVVLGFWS